MSRETDFSVQQLEPTKRIVLDETVLSIATCPKKSLSAAITADGELHLLSASPEFERASFVAHPEGALGLDWSPQGVWLATTSQNGIVSIWDPKDLNRKMNCKLGERWVEHLAWSSDRRLAASMEKKLFIIDVSEGAAVREIASFSHSVTGLQWLNDAELVVTMNGGAVKLSLSSGSAKKVGWFEYPEAMLCLAVSPDQRFAAIGCQDSAARVWALNKNNDALEMCGYSEKIKVLAWDRASNFLAISGGSQINVWSFKGKGPRGSAPRELMGHRSSVMAIRFSPCVNRLASVDRNGVLCLWDLDKDLSLPIAAAVNPSALYTCAWDATGRFLLTGDQEGSIAVWDTGSL